MADRLRVVFFGTPPFAVATLDALLGSRHEVVGCVTQPDRPRGRGHKAAASAVKTRALAAGIPVLQPERLDDLEFLRAFDGLRSDLGVVAAYGRILSGRLLTSLPRGFLNVHASLLPRYRGAAPVNRAIISGEQETGVTIMRMVRALDAGPILAAARRAIRPEETSEDVEQDLARLGAALLVSTLENLLGGSVVEVPQDEAAASYAARLTKDDGVMDWTRPATELHDLIRGLHPWPHAFTFHRGNRLIVLRSRVAGESHSSRPGTVLVAEGDRLAIATGSGALDLVELQAEGKRPLTTRAFLAGYRLHAGERLTPAP